MIDEMNSNYDSLIRNHFREGIMPDDKNKAKTKLFDHRIKTHLTISFSKYNLLSKDCAVQIETISKV